ncbi:response regulator [Polaribacter vadi]|uniref:ATP-binding response regulator n=1 Tax=Polaribacter TaxID=52959 RepID=UPI001C086641|nr:MULTISPECIES: ATP-binding protein [Polaribacter]MBU3011979.1 response regulator [Polaribacter vadi]MDO6741794.1 ATP-binding protein [Polaribacter sp. 1_MG-2023]
MIPPNIENAFIEIVTNKQGIITAINAGKFAKKEFDLNTSIFNPCPFLFGTLDFLTENETIPINGMVICSDEKEYNVDLELLNKNNVITILIQERTEIYKTITKLNQSRNDLYFLKREISKKNKELIVLRKASDKANEEKSRFLAMMSHEIRNPLNTILGYTQMISEEDLSKKVEDYIKYLSIAGRNLKVIVDDILDLSRIEAGKLKLAVEQININDIIEGIYINYKNQNSNDKVNIELSKSDLIPDVLYGDGVRVTQIITNLMSNALKFTKKGMVSLQANLILDSPETTEIRFKIIDTGRGMTPEQTVLIFEEYGQTELDDNRIHGGAGLGLAIVKRLVSAMQGTISVESAIDKGTVFSVEIPFKKVDSYIENKIQEVPETKIISLNGKKVLLADDDHLNQKITIHFLEKEGVKVTVVDNGLMAYNVLNKETFDIVLLDINMPELTGVELVKRKEHLDFNTKTPFLALTGFATEEDKSHYLSVGFKDVIFKPYKPVELIGKLQKSLINID